MLSKKIDRALRICSAVQEFRPEVEAEMCDGDDIWEEPVCAASSALDSLF